MDFQDFRRSGHWPTLLAAFLYFDFSFMVWVVLGPLSLYMAQDIAFDVSQKFTIVAIPVLFGALLRVPLGMLADHIGPKRAGLLAQSVVMAALAYAWLVGFGSILAVELFGIMLGVAGASFAVALPQASRWYPPKYQGIVLGIAGAGNMGVVLDSLLVPWAAEAWGWRAVFGILLIPMAAVFVLYMLMARDAPEQRTPVSVRNYAAVLRDRDTWWFMFFYSITFGGFVGLGNALPLYFTTWYHVSGVAAGLMVALVVFAGSMFRPIGGWLADRVGGIRSLQVLFCVVAVSYVVVGLLPQGPAPLAGAVADAKVAGWGIGELSSIAWAAVAAFFVGAMALGMGNGSVFQLVPLRFRREIGVVTGLVGAAGGVGGFFLAKTLGWSKVATGGFGAGFFLFAGLALVGLIGLAAVKTRWRTTWGAVAEARV